MRRRRPSVFQRIVRLGWKVLRVLMVMASALGPGMPPPPPPPKPTADMIASGAKEKED
ncbi:MAG: hypothetical protein IPK82_43045 [Polyangiaceae bacterium]|nr:hypothetical protein [Polyangiaceae bacterium]